MSDIVEVATFGTTFAARAAAAHLEAEGIRSSVVTDNAGGAFPSMSLLSRGVRLVVAAADADRAAEVLVDFAEDDLIEQLGEDAEEGSEV
jgi:hypothetical protein